MSKSIGDAVISAPPGLRTEVEARRALCPMYDKFLLPGPTGQPTMHFVNCRAGDCMAWRTTTHSKMENREPRPLGFCGLIEYPPLAVTFTELPETFEGDLPTPNAPSSIIQQ